MVARLLFKCVGWVKNISGLLNICFNDQVKECHFMKCLNIMGL